MAGRQLGDQLADARPELVREVRRRRADEGVDVVDRVVRHRRNLTTRAIRRKRLRAGARPLCRSCFFTKRARALRLWCARKNLRRFAFMCFTNRRSTALRRSASPAGQYSLVDADAFGEAAPEIAPGAARATTAPIETTIETASGRREDGTAW